MFRKILLATAAVVSHHHAYRPEVIRLDGSRVVIDGERYEATIDY